MAISDDIQYFHITAIGSYQIDMGLGNLAGIMVNTPGVGLIALADFGGGGSANSPIGTTTLAAGQTPTFLNYQDVRYVNGLWVNINATMDITVLYH